MIPLVGFLPATDPRVLSTVEAIQRELMEDGLVRRYQTTQTADGLEGSEGVFLACSFWLADNLVLQGRYDDANALFKRLLALARSRPAFRGIRPGLATPSRQLSSGLLSSRDDQYRAQSLQPWPRPSARQRIRSGTTATYHQGWRACPAPVSPRTLPATRPSETAAAQAHLPAGRASALPSRMQESIGLPKCLRPQGHSPSGPTKFFITASECRSHRGQR